MISSAIANGVPTNVNDGGQLVRRRLELQAACGGRGVLSAYIKDAKCGEEGTVSGLPEWNGAPLTVSVGGVTGTGTA
jgi:hypothetical protein